jgi:hypothetical protein
MFFHLVFQVEGIFLMDRSALKGAERFGKRATKLAFKKQN